MLIDKIQLKFPYAYQLIEMSPIIFHVAIYNLLFVLIKNNAFMKKINVMIQKKKEKKNIETEMSLTERTLHVRDYPFL